MNILFWIYKMKVNASGEAPIVMRVTHEKERVNISLDVRVNPAIWDATKQKIKGNSEWVTQNNNLLNSSKAKILKAYDTLFKKGNSFTVKQVVEEYNVKEEKQMGLLEAFRIYNQNVEAKLKVEYAPATLKRYNSTLRKVERFVNSLGRKEITLNQVSREFIMELDQFFRAVLRSNNNTTVKNLRHVKTVLRMCRIKDWMQHDPFDFMSFRETPTLREYLSTEEVKKWRDVKLPNKGLEITRDVFLFQVFTGLAHVDVHKLASSHVKLGNDSKRWLYITRTKTNTLTQVPLLPIAEEILKRYADHPKCVKSLKLLPVPCNQVMNRRLKVVAKLAGINKVVQTHTGRHTYATTILLGNGVTMETTSKLLGHSNIRTTQIYGKITETKIAQDLVGLNEKLKKKMRR